MIKKINSIERHIFIQELTQAVRIMETDSAVTEVVTGTDQ